MSSLWRSALFLAVVAVAVSACGKADLTTTSATARSSATAVQRRGTPLTKKRYLAHFKTNCSQSNSLSNTATALLRELVNRIGHGEPRAVAELAVYLGELSRGLKASLRSIEGLGAPPNPGRRQGEDYLRDTAQVIESTRALSVALTDLDGAAISAAIKRMTAATAAANAAAKSYGIPTCPSTPTPSTPTPSTPTSVPTRSLTA